MDSKSNFIVERPGKSETDNPLNQGEAHDERSTHLFDRGHRAMNAPTLSAPRSGLETKTEEGDQAIRPGTTTAETWTSLRLLVLAICCLLNALDGMDIVIFSYIAPVLIENWHITPGTMGIIFSASLWGMMIGCLFIAPLADRFGRRRLMLVMLAVIGCSMIASGLSRTVPELLATRFAIGIGIGAILASMAALVSEYAPTNQAGLAVSIENAGYPLGAVATGLVAAKLLPIYGWQHLLLGAGMLSLLAFVLTAALLPESVDFLLSVQPRGALTRANRIITRLGGKPVQTLPPKPAAARKFKPGAIFGQGRAMGTIALWIGVLTAFMSLYFTISWFTRLAAQAGLALDNAIYLGSVLNLGAFVGTIAMGGLGRLMGERRVSTCFLVAASLLLVLFGTVHWPLAGAMAVAFLLGTAIYGGFNSFYALAVGFYPSAIRSTGIGWAMGVGRIGAAFGPMLGGFLLDHGFSLATIMCVFALPLLIAACCAPFVRITRV